MNDFVLPLFPSGSVATTVTTSVWVGVLFVVLGNLRFGWTLSALVVPGYLVPLMIVRPVSVVVILLEAIATYLLVAVVSRAARYSGYWSDFFGRDRFLGLVIGSVLVRVTAEGFVLPRFGDWLNAWMGWHWNHGDHLHSVGLVIVALTANYFWKPGLLRGSGPLAASTFATFAVVRYVLIPYTTLDVGSLQYVYEDIASSLLASPKAYILLLTTATIASHMNLRFSWEYNGLLIPALLSLLWTEPSKLLVTMLEGVVITLLAKAVLRTRRFQGVTMEGGRKIAFFFTLAFLYRLGVSWFVWLFLPETKATDYFGFGYLLSTLVAILYHQRGHSLRITLATLQVSLGGFLVANAIGYALLWVPLSKLAAESDSPQTTVVVSELSLAEMVRQDKLHYYEPTNAHEAVRSPADLHRFRRLLTSLRDHSHSAVSARSNEELLARLQSHCTESLRQLGLQCVLIESRYVYVRGLVQPQRDGLVILDLDRPDGVMITVPALSKEPYSLDAALYLFQQLEGSGLIVAGAQADSRLNEVAVARGKETLFDVARSELGPGRTLQIRGSAEMDDSATNDPNGPRARIEIAKAIPQGLDLSRLRSLLGGFDLAWDPSIQALSAAEVMHGAFARLSLTRTLRATLLSRLAVTMPCDGPNTVTELRGRLLPWLLSRKELMAGPGSECYVPARQEELIMLDQEVLGPLLALIRNGASNRETLTLAAINRSAAAFGLSVARFTDTESNRCYFVLYEATPMRHWGIYVLSEHSSTPQVWEVPRPLWERYTFEFAAEQFVNQHPLALLVSGAHFQANSDGTADVSHQANRFTLFNLVHQAVVREHSGKPTLVIQSRAMKGPVDVDVLLATDDGSRSHATLSPLKSSLADMFASTSFRVAVADGSESYAGYELGATATSLAMRYSTNVEFVAAWLAPSLRQQFRRQSENGLLLAQLHAVGIELRTDDCVRDSFAGSPFTLVAEDDPDWLSVREVIATYLATRDSLALQQLRNWNQLDVQAHLDRITDQLVLRISWRDGRSAVINLAELRGADPIAHHAEALTAEVIEQFVASRRTWLCRPTGVVPDRSTLAKGGVE